MMKLSALDACVQFTLDGTSVIEGFLLNWKETILEFVVVFVSNIYGCSQ